MFFCKNKFVLNINFNLCDGVCEEKINFEAKREKLVYAEVLGVLYGTTVNMGAVYC
jgi:hypothetical protein